MRVDGGGADGGGAAITKQIARRAPAVDEKVIAGLGRWRGPRPAMVACSACSAWGERCIVLKTNGKRDGWPSSFFRWSGEVELESFLEAVDQDRPSAGSADIAPCVLPETRRSEKWRSHHLALWSRMIPRASSTSVGVVETLRAGSFPR